MNCIEADNEITLKPNRLDILEETIEKLEKRISLFRKILENKIEHLSNYAHALEEDIENFSCPKCHPKFDEDGIL